MAIKDLKDLRAKCELEKNFNVRWEMENPLREWAKKVFETECGKLGMHTDSQIFKWALDQDSRCNEIPEDKMGVLLDNDEYIIMAFIDYDDGCTWVKFTDYHKESGLSEKNSLIRQG